MAKRKPDPQPRANRPAATVTVTTEQHPDTGRFRGIVSRPNESGGRAIIDYAGSSYYEDEGDAQADAVAWCRDRGITCQVQ